MLSATQRANSLTLLMAVSHFAQLELRPSPLRKQQLITTSAFVAPTLLLLLVRGVRPNNSFKPSPLRGLGRDRLASGGPA